MLKKLTYEEVATIHTKLTEHFKNSEDPISPEGIKDIGLLASAIGRQETGLGEELKYSTPTSNAATLIYGICMNHCFYNGNKRTAFVSGLIHLDKNLLLPGNVDEAQFYSLMLHLADHSLQKLKDEDSKKILKGDFRNNTHFSADQEVEFLAKWLKKKTTKRINRAREIRLGQLKEVLKHHGCRSIDKEGETFFIRSITLPRRLFPDKKIELTARFKSRNNQTKISPGKMDDIRRDLQLDVFNGFSDDNLFQEKYQVDWVLNEYRNLLKKLAKT